MGSYALVKSSSMRTEGSLLDLVIRKSVMILHISEVSVLISPLSFLILSLFFLG